MKNKHIRRSSLYIGIMCAGIITLSSCAKKLDEVYLNPNNPTVVPIESLLPNVLSQMTATALPPAGGGGGSYGPLVDGVLVGRYIQYWQYYSTGDTYDQMGGPAPGATDNMGAIWAMHYYGIGQNNKKIIEWGIEQKKWDYVGVAHAIFAWSWLTLTEHYGEVILRQAFNTSLQQFDYDPQPAVYDTVRAICNTAIDYLNRTGDNVSQKNLALGDAYFYNGDVNKWKKFVYGVLARSYAHLTAKDIYNTNHYYDSVIKYTNLSLTSNEDNATQKFNNQGTSGTNNWFGPFRSNAGTLRQSAYITNLMTGTSATSPFTGVFDPRTPYFLRENTNGTYKGIQPNLGTSSLSTNDQPRNFWGGPFATTTSSQDTAGRYLFNNYAEIPVMTAAEVQFMKAEAYYRKGDKASALTAYTTGISLNFDMLSTKYNDRVPAAKLITPAAKAAYMSNPKIVPPTADGLTLTHIMLQKYIALYGYGTEETWTDMRRYHYTDIDPATGKQVYADFTLPSTIYSYNNGQPVYRARPRYNSENLYNVPALQSIGALANDYNTKKPWFTLPQ
jgi:tetratricopeptide (TPR) repeat protein